MARPKKELCHSFLRPKTLSATHFFLVKKAMRYAGNFLLRFKATISGRFFFLISRCKKKRIKSKKSPENLKKKNAVKFEAETEFFFLWPYHNYTHFHIISKT